MADNVQERGSPGNFWSALLTGGATWLLVRAGVLLFMLFTTSTIFSVIGKTMPRGKRATLLRLMDFWTGWDAAWYLKIATGGYGKQSAAFFPLFPLLVHGVGSLLQAVMVPIFPVLSGFLWSTSSLLVANLGGLLALVSMVYLVRQEGGDQGEVLGTLGALVAFPVAFIMMAGYTESLMVALTTLTLLFARRRNWWAATGAAYLAALTHAPGVLLALPILWEFGAAHEWWSALARRSVARAPRLPDLAAGAAAVIAAPLGAATYVLYLWHRFGTPLALVRAEAYWGRRAEPPWRSVSLVAHALTGPHGGYWQALTILDVGLFLLFLLVLALSVRLIPVSFTLYGFAVLALVAVEISPRTLDPVEGTGRYLLGAVPVFLAFARLTRRLPGLQVGCIVASALGQGALLALWMIGGFVE